MKKFLTTLFLLFSATFIFGQASMSVRKMKDLTITLQDGEEKTLTVIQDEFIDNQWYYVPDKPRLSERRFANGDRKEPVFSLIKYTYQNPDNPQDDFITDGILQVGLTLGLPPEEFDLLKEKLIQDENRDDIQLTSIQITDAELAFYEPETASGTSLSLVGSGGAQGAGIAPIYANQQMILQVPLTDVGNQVIEALTTKTYTGLPAIVKYSYKRVTPKNHVRISWNGTQLQEFYNKNTKFKSQVSGSYWIFRASAAYEREKQQLREDIKQSSFLTIESLIGEDSRLDEQMDRYIDIALQQITQQLSGVKPPEQIEPLTTSDCPSGNSNKKGIFSFRASVSGSACYKVAEKQVNINQFRSGEVIVTEQRIFNQKSTAEGFIGIGNYDKDTRKKLVIELEQSETPFITLSLPIVDQQLQDNLNGITLETSLTDANGNKLQRVHTNATRLWTLDKGWHMQDGTPSKFIRLSLRGLNEDRNDVYYTYSVSIVGNRSINFTSNIVRINSDSTLQPQALMKDDFLEVVVVSPEFLPWYRVEDEGELIRASGKILFTEDGQSNEVNFSFRPRKVNGQYVNPENYFHIMKKSNESIRLKNMNFQIRNTGFETWPDSSTVDLGIKGTEVVLDEQYFDPSNLNN